MKPLTRKEMLLDGAAKGNLDTFKPATREEVFAKRALANGGGSGGGCVDIKMVGMGNWKLMPYDVFACVDMDTMTYDEERVNKLLTDIRHALLNNVCRFKLELSPISTYDAEPIVDTGYYVVNTVLELENGDLVALVIPYDYDNDRFGYSERFVYSEYIVRDMLEQMKG